LRILPVWLIVDRGLAALMNRMNVNRKPETTLLHGKMHGEKSR